MKLPKQAQATVVIPEVDQEVTLLRGFRDLVREGLGYYFGAKSLRAEASDKSSAERKDANKIRKNITSHLEEWIKDANLEAYQDELKKLKDAREKVSAIVKPFSEKINPLNKAWRYMVMVAMPDSLKELGNPIQPTFSLSEWIAEAVKPKKKR